MTDSIAILPPGWRALDDDGDVYTQAVLEFLAGDGATPLTVYSDYGLGTDLGTSVECNSGGYPTSDGNALTQIYTGSDPYYVRLKNNGVTIWTIGPIKGALDTSSFLTDSDVTPNFPLINTSSNLTPAAADKSKRYNIDCSGGDKSVTHGNAATLGDGWSARYRHDGTANQVLITGTSSELFKVGGRAGVTAFALTRRGQEVEVSCDGTGFMVAEVSPPLFDTTGIILIADRLSTPPGSPQAGARYIVGSSPTGDWSGFAEHDIAEFDGQGGWFNITPPTDCGWMAYVQDEDDFYVYSASAWGTLGALLLAVTANIATQAEMEAATAVNKIVTPGRQHYHPGHPKCWGYATVSAGTPTLQTSYNITSITDDGAGLITFTIATDFSSANWCGVLGGGGGNMTENSKAAGSVQLRNTNSSGTNTDPDAWGFAGFGDHA